MHLRDPLLIFFSCRIVGGLQFVPRKCFTHKATRKPVLKPNHYGATYDYNTEWVWCEKFLKQSVFVTVNRALPFRLLTFRLYPGIVSGIWPLVLHLLLDDMESHSCSFQEETCHRDPLPQQSRSPPHPLKSWRQDPQWHHLHGSRQSPWWQKWRQTFSGWLSHQHVKHSQPLQDESFPRSFGTAGGYKFVPSPALASEAFAATARGWFCTTWRHPNEPAIDSNSPHPRKPWGSSHPHAASPGHRGNHPCQQTPPHHAESQSQARSGDKVSPEAGSAHNAADTLSPRFARPMCGRISQP